MESRSGTEQPAYSAMEVLRKRQLSVAVRRCLLVAVFAWIWLVQVAGVLFFSRGFLLSRTALPDISRPDSTSGDLKQFEKAVVIIIDALRFDFVTPIAESDQHDGEETSFYKNGIQCLSELYEQNKSQSALFRFIADPPTTTLQRLKGLTTGSLPTFVDAGSNFAGNAIEEDNWIHQLRLQNKTIAFMGDDTWTALFPDSFAPELAFPFESLNVHDLHTVDQGVRHHLFDLLSPDKRDKWDVLIAHYLGVDHAGHRYGPNHPSMKAKLEEMDADLRRVLANIDDKTLLVVLGDHGMDPKGDHGGDSQLEVESTLFLYSKELKFGRVSDSTWPVAPVIDGYREISQIDLVPTLSLLLGLPIPFNNLGGPVPEVFIGPNMDYRRLASAYKQTSQQISCYRTAYGLENSEYFDFTKDFDIAEENFSSLLSLSSKEPAKYNSLATLAIDSFFICQQGTLDQCRQMWVKFDLSRIVIGMGTLAISLFNLILFILAFRKESFKVGESFARAFSWGVITGAFGIIFHGAITNFVDLARWEAFVLGSVLGSSIGFIFSCAVNISLAFPSFWTCLAVLLTVLHTLIFASNSFTVWEDKIIHYMLSTFSAAALISSLSIKSNDRAMAIFHCCTFAILGRLSSLSTICREEQMPYCSPTFYSSTSSSVSSPFVLFFLTVSAIMLPSIVGWFYNQTASFVGPSSIWISTGLRLGLILASVYWLLETLEFSVLAGKNFAPFKMLIARLVLGLSLIVGNFAWANGPLCISVVAETAQEEDDRITPTTASTTLKSRMRTTILGYYNVYGSFLFLFIINWYLAISFLSKPVGSISLAALLWQILTLAEILDLNGLSNSIIGSVVLGLLGHAYFFSTGHQATIPSIQWDIGFVLSSRIIFPITHICIILNTFGSHILVSLAAPLLAVWKKPPQRSSESFLNIAVWPCAVLLAYYTSISCGSLLFAAHLRRHLMVWKIFAPRYMVAALTLLTVGFSLAFFSVVAIGMCISSVMNVFG